MSQLISDSALHRLQERLQTAESLVRTALKSAEEENPLFEPTRQLLGVHQDIRELLMGGRTKDESPSEEDCKVVHAAIEIEREEHTMKADAMDILKAFFMWKDDPEERAKQKSA